MLAWVVQISPPRIKVFHGQQCWTSILKFPEYWELHAPHGRKWRPTEISGNKWKQMEKSWFVGKIEWGINSQTLNEIMCFDRIFVRQNTNTIYLEMVLISWYAINFWTAKFGKIHEHQNSRFVHQIKCWSGQSFVKIQFLLVHGWHWRLKKNALLQVKLFNSTKHLQACINENCERIQVILLYSTKHYRSVSMRIFLNITLSPSSQLFKLPSSDLEGSRMHRPSWRIFVSNFFFMGLHSFFLVPKWIAWA